MMALAVLLPETGWALDFALRLMFGPERLPTAGTSYMFDSGIPLFVRTLSLFHLFLPVLLLWLVRRLGYRREALCYQSLLAWLVLPISYFFADPSKNINFVRGFGDEPQTWMPASLFLVTVMLFFPIAVYLPTHWLLSRLYARESP